MTSSKGVWKTLGGRDAVDVFVFFVCFDQAGVAGHVGQDAELDLGVVRVGKGISVTGNECFADLPAEFRFHRDILQVGIRGADASCGGNGLVERRVDPLVVSHKSHKALRIGGAELGEAAVLKDIIDDRVFGRQCFQDACGCGVAGFGLFAAGGVPSFQRGPRPAVWERRC